MNEAAAVLTPFSAAGLVFTYLLSSLGLSLAAVRLVARDNGARPLDVVMASFGAGPLVIALLLEGAVSFAPGRSDGFYLATVGGLVAVPMLWGLAGWRQCRGMLAGGPRWDWVGVLLALGLAGLTAMLLYVSLGFPVIENDAAQYAFVARRAYETRSLAFYPLVVPDPATGFYAVSSHPPSYYCMILWHYMLQGTAAIPGLEKFISPVHALYSALLIGLIMRRFGVVPMLGAPFIYLATPVLFSQTVFHGIDPIRLHANLLVFNALLVVLRDDRLPARVLAGLTVGLAMYSHSLGAALMVPAFSVAYLIESPTPWRGKVAGLLTVGVAAALPGLWQYLENLMIFGTPIQDSLPIYRLVPQLAFNEFQQITTNLDAPWRVVMFGIARPFTETEMFGPWNWLAAFYLAIWGREAVKDPVQRCLLWFVLVFMALVLATVLAGAYGIIVGARYLATMQMASAFFAVLALERMRSYVVTRFR